jgi:hypothetical protein
VQTATKHLTTVADTLLAVSLNIVLQKAPVSNGSGLFYFLQSILKSGAFFNTHNVSGHAIETTS